MSEEKNQMEFINHADSIGNLMEELCLNTNLSDVTFIVEEERIPAHRFILIARSKYFCGMLTGKFTESNQNEIKLQVDPGAFKILLKYIYTGTMAELTKISVNLIYNTISLAHEYGHETLSDELLIYLTKCRLNVENVFEIMCLAYLHNKLDVFQETLNFADKNAAELTLKINKWQMLSKNVLCELIKRDEFAVNEVDIFKAVLCWGENQTKNELKCVLKHIRFTLMQISEIKTIVAPTGILESDEIEKIIIDIKELECLPFRNGTTHRNQIDCYIIWATKNYGYIWEGGSGLKTGPMVFKLSTKRMINCITLDIGFIIHVPYYIEVSQNQREWIRVVDYSKYACFGVQHIYFDLCPVRYIYFVPTYKDYNLCELTVDYRIFTVPLKIDGYIAPIYNERNNNLSHELPQTHCFLTVSPTKCTVFTLFQPSYVNCLTINLPKKIFTKISQLETSLDDENYKSIEFHFDHMESMIIFKPHVVSKMRITCEEILSGDFCRNIFYLPGDLSSFFIKQ